MKLNKLKQIIKEELFKLKINEEETRKTDDEFNPNPPITPTSGRTDKRGCYASIGGKSYYCEKNCNDCVDFDLETAKKKNGWLPLILPR